MFTNAPQYASNRGPSVATPKVHDASQPRAVSPFYYRYLRDQATSILASGGDEEAIRQFLDMERNKPLALLPENVPEGVDMPTNLRGVSMAMLQGATFGFGDEAVGALYGKITGIGARAGIDEYRAEYEAWANEHGKTAFVANLAGGFLTGGAFGVGKSIAGNVVRAGAAGALAGAGYGEGDFTLDGLGERTRSALLGAVTAGALGGIVGGAITVAKPVVRPLVQKLAPNAFSELIGITPETRSRELLARALVADGLDPAKVAKRVAELQATGTPVTIAEVGGDATLGLLTDALARRSPLKTALIEDLRARQAEQGDRLTGQLFLRAITPNRFGTANAYEIESQLHTHMLNESAPYYKDAFEQVVKPSEEMLSLLKHPKIYEAYQRGAQMAADEDVAGIGHGLTVGDLDNVLNLVGTAPKNPSPELAARLASMGITRATGELPVRGIDMMKRGLDAIVEDMLPKNTLLTQDARARLLAQNGRALFAIRDKIIAETREQVASYGQALDTYGGYAEAKSALNLGKEFRRKAPEIVRRELASISPNNRDFYRVGAVQNLYEQVLGGSGVPRDAATQFFGAHLLGGNTLQSRRLAALFDSPHAALDFMRNIAGEARVSYSTSRMANRLPRLTGIEKTEQAIEGNVVTARGSLGLTLLTAGRQAVLRARSQMSDQEAEELTHLASKGLQNPAELRTLVSDLFGTYAPPTTLPSVAARVGTAARAAVTPAAVRTRVATTLGQIVGR